MPRANRHLLVPLIGGGFLLTLFAASNPFARTRPTELLAAADDLACVPIYSRDYIGFADAEVVETHDLATLTPAEGRASLDSGPAAHAPRPRRRACR